MQLHDDHNSIQTNIQTESHAFTIHATAKAFKILSSSLYKFKVAAVIRELACNALDSHMDAGNTDPFVVHLPSVFEPYFAIEDFGTGMTPEQIGELYTGYFASSKDQRNDQIGALGLGSKSPFAYTSMFTIDSIKDGMHTTYSAFLDSKSMPTYMTIKSEATTNPAGVRITFPVPEADIDEFAREAAAIFWAFDADKQPKITGASRLYISYTVDFKAIKAIRSGTGWNLYETYPNVVHQRYRKTVLVKTGNILYPITDLFKLPQFSDLAFYENLPLILDMPLGSCDIDPSREELEYDQLTKDNIHEKLLSIHQDIMATAAEKINKAPTLWEAARIAFTVFNSFFHTGDSKVPFIYQNKQWHYKEPRSLLKNHYATRFGNPYDSSCQTVRAGHMDDTISLELGENALIVSTEGKDLNSQYLRIRTRLYCLQHNLSSTKIFYVHTLSQQEWEDLGCPSRVTADLLPKPYRSPVKGHIRGTVTCWDTNASYEFGELTDKIKIFIIRYRQQYSINEAVDTFHLIQRKHIDRLTDMFNDILLPRSILKHVYVVPLSLFKAAKLKDDPSWKSLEAVALTGSKHLLKKYSAAYLAANTASKTMAFYAALTSYTPTILKSDLSPSSYFLQVCTALNTLKETASQNKVKDKQAIHILRHLDRALYPFPLYKDSGMEGVQVAYDSDDVVPDPYNLYCQYPLLQAVLRAYRYQDDFLLKNSLRVNLGDSSSEYRDVDATHPAGIFDILEYVKLIDAQKERSQEPS